MFQTDICDYAQIGLDNIGAVQSAAQSHLNDCHIHLLFGKILECHSGGQLKERGVQWFEEILFLSHEVHHVVFRNLLSVDANALAEVK